MKQLIPALLAALCLLLASCGTSPAATLPMGTDETPVESEASESTGPWAPTGEQMQKENAVTDLLNESGEGYSYRIPQLNCQTQDAELINTAISDELMPLVDEAHTAQAQGYDPVSYTHLPSKFQTQILSQKGENISWQSSYWAKKLPMH